LGKWILKTTVDVHALAMPIYFIRQAVRRVWLRRMVPVLLIFHQPMSLLNGRQFRWV
jgi:hypothetical protein